MCDYERLIDAYRKENAQEELRRLVGNRSAAYKHYLSTIHTEPVEKVGEAYKKWKSAELELDKFLEDCI
jgi:hypothetical protein